MSTEGFHVHGPHDHELEHAGQHGHDTDSFASRIAVVTALMATVGALFGYMGGATQNDAAMFKNNAAIKKTEANDQWNYYQAKAQKQNIAKLALLLTNVDHAKFESEITRYESEKADIKKKADGLEEESKLWDERSEQALHQHHRWAQAMTAVQIAISLAAITLLTRKRWLQLTSYGVAGLGAAIAALAWFHI